MKRKLGETFQDGEVTLKVELENDNDVEPCCGCHYEIEGTCGERNKELTGRCTGDDSGEEDVIFVKVSLSDPLSQIDSRKWAEGL